MPPPYTQLFIHIVWATQDRLALVTPDVELHVYNAIQAQCHGLSTPVLAIGGLADHVHLLVRLSPAVAVSELVAAAKVAAADLMTSRVRAGRFFAWQEGFGAFSVPTEAVPRAIQYVRSQPALHGAGTLWDEWERCEAPPTPA